MRDILTPAQTAERTTLTERQLAQLRYSGKGPAFVRLTHKSIAYRASDVDAWIESRTRTITGGE